MERERQHGRARLRQSVDGVQRLVNRRSLRTEWHSREQAGARQEAPQAALGQMAQGPWRPSPETAEVGDAQRHLQDPTVGTGPVNAASMLTEIGAAFLPVRKARSHGNVRPNVQPLQDGPGVWAHAIAAGPVAERTDAKAGGDRRLQRRQLPLLQSGGQIACETVEGVDRLVERRIDPRMKLKSDFAFARRRSTAQQLAGSWIDGDRPVHQVDRPCAAVHEAAVAVGDRGNMGGARVLARRRACPVELLLGVHEDQEHWRPVGRKDGIIHPARRTIEATGERSFATSI